MNFLMRSTTSVYSERTPIPVPRPDVHHRSASAGSSLESIASKDPYSRYNANVDLGITNDLNSKHHDLPVVDKHLDVAEEEGWITIPCKELPENWDHVPDIQSLRPLDRSFLFPGEQVHILACLSACKQDTQIITPSAMARKNGKGHDPEKESGNIENRNNLVFGEGEPSTSGEQQLEDITDSESLLHMEAHKTQTALLLHKFENSHFFARISDFNEPLWSKRSSLEHNSNSSEADSQKASTIKTKEIVFSSAGAVIDRGSFDATISGGVARNSVKCFALPNGDIVVLLQVIVGVNFLKDPCIEILQFEKCRGRMLSPDRQMNAVYTNQDPCAELLNWMIPLENGKPPSHPLSHLTSNPGIGSTSQRSNVSASADSQLFSIGNFRSYSMSSLPQATTTPNAPVKAASSKPSFDLEDYDQIPTQIYSWRKTGVEELLSFRGVSLPQDRFSVCCGLEGVYTPGRRWRRKLEIIQPLEIHSFSADLNSEDLLCVQLKNVAPAHAPDMVIYIDAINIIIEESTKIGAVSSLPILCVEAGNDHSLPNLALRRGEEHSFILKPETSALKNLRVQDHRSSRLSKLQYGNRTSKLCLDQYAVMVKCRSNFTSSRLFIKKPTSWRPRNSRDIMLSIASKMSGQPPGAYEKTCQLPMQMLTLQASNLTSEDLTLTVLAPASSTSPPSVVSLNSPMTPMSPFVGFSEILARVNSKRGLDANKAHSFTSMLKENEEQSYDGKAKAVSVSDDDVIPSSGVSCTHLWLQSRVPLGCIPPHSVATVKLELLPLTDGIITLDTLQIDVKEKGIAYTPECSLKISATSSISNGLM